MREILFRGKRLDTGEWAEGSLMSVCGRNGKDDYASIRVFTHHKDGDKEWVDWEDYEVDPATVGQYTGLKDKNGERIWEGDIVKWDDQSNGRYWRFAVVKIDPDIQFDCSPIDCINGVLNSSRYNFRFGNFAYKDTDNHLYVIGNIHDNADLIK